MKGFQHFKKNFFYCFPKVITNELGKIKNSCVPHFFKQNDFMQRNHTSASSDISDSLGVRHLMRDISFPGH